MQPAPWTQITLPSKTEGNKDSHSSNDNASAARCSGPLPFLSGKCEPVGGKDEESQRNDNEVFEEEAQEEVDGVVEVEKKKWRTKWRTEERSMGDRRGKRRRRTNE